MPDQQENRIRVPEWMQPYGIQESEWQYISKAALRAMQRPDRNLKERVWATGMLHSPGYRGELAQITRKGKRVMPMTAADIGQELKDVAVAFYTEAGIRLTKEQEKDLRPPKEKIRKAIAALELDGIAARKTADGKLITGLTSQQVARLKVKGEIHLYFWITPRPADPEMVRQTFESAALSFPQGVVSGPPLVSISQILRTFQFPKLEKSVLTNPLYQKIIREQYEIARESFQQGVLAGLPEGAVTRPPEGVAAGGALESKRESKTETKQQQHGKPADSATEAEGESAAAALSQELLHRDLSVQSPKMLTRIMEAFDPAPLYYFLLVLDRRTKQGKIGVGALPLIAADAKVEYQKTFTQELAS